MISVGQQAPDFKLPIDDGSHFQLSSYLGKKVLIYFYPKDDTPGCTTEACDFRESIAQFNQLNCVVLGISKDSIASHIKFKQKYGLNFPLGSDEDGSVCQLYGTWAEKSMFGRKYLGITRSTFLINEQGVITHYWPTVKVSTHIKDILAALSA